MKNSIVMRKLLFALLPIFWVSCDNVGIEPNLKVLPETEFTFTAKSSEVSLTIECESEWMISGTNEWCSVNPTKGVSGDTVVLSVVENHQDVERCVMLVVGCGTEVVPIYVYQEAEDQNLIQHPQPIDLGLSVKWSSCNLCADSPEQSGGFFAWGETSQKTEYGGANYSLWVDVNSDGCMDAEEVGLDFDISGTNYDAAHVILGGEWRMPTRDEVNELCYECKWSWGTKNSVAGMYVTGPNGNSIFLPFAGNYVSTSHFTGDFALYWSSTPCDWGAFCMDVSLTRHTWLQRSYYEGLPIRPVKD